MVRPKSCFLYFFYCLIVISCSTSKQKNVDSVNFKTKNIVQKSKKDKTSLKNKKQLEIEKKALAEQERLDLMDLERELKAAQEREDLEKFCKESLRKLPGKISKNNIHSICTKVELLSPTCYSVKKKPIYHYDSTSTNKKALKILAIAIFHGDEPTGGSVARAWMERLTDLDPRNHWRIIPILNPDGWEINHRTNANGVDINRNYPTKNWKVNAAHHWKRIKRNKRKYPGKSPASEPETKCSIEHIKSYDPDFIVAIHTPLGLLDFDGPKVKFPKGHKLPWVKLATYPGSLGRYMWKEAKIPVLTIELKGEGFLKNLGDLDMLQDVSGVMAILSGEIQKKKNNKKNKVKVQ